MNTIILSFFKITKKVLCLCQEFHFIIVSGYELNFITRFGSVHKFIDIKRTINITELINIPYLSCNSAYTSLGKSKRLRFK